MDLFVRLKKTAILLFCVACMLITHTVVASSSANYILKFDSVNSGGEDTSSSTNYGIRDTYGEQGSGDVSSTNFQIQAGYRSGENATSASIVAYCGDGNVDAGEQCDSGVSNGICPAACSASCTTNSCGGGGGNVPPIPPPVQQAPVISNILISNITPFSARISWATDKAANSLVVYGLTSGYASGTVVNAALGTDHVIDLSNLSSASTYHLLVNSVDSGGLSTTSSDRQFTTLVAPAPPKISNITVTQITDSSVIINWDTDVPATSFVGYSLGQDYNTTTTVPGLTLAHAVQLTGLTQKTTYNFLPGSADSNGQLAVSQSGSFSTLADVTPPANVSNFVAIPSDTKNNLSWNNPADPDVAGTRVMRKLGAYPAQPTDGDLVYSGTDTAKTDAFLTNGVKYFYTAFAFDTHGNFASGALASATPVGPVLPPVPPQIPPQIPPPVPPVIPPVVPPSQNNGGIIILPDGQSTSTSIVSTGTATLVSAYSSARISLDRDSNGVVGMLAGSRVEVTVLPSVSADEVLQASITIAGSTYALERSADGVHFVASFTAPVVGEYQAIAVFTFKTIVTAQKIDRIQTGSGGKIVEGAMAGTTSKVLSGAAVQLYQQANGTWVPFGAIQETDSEGSYAFIVPNGQYYATVQKEGYRPTTSPSRNVSGNLFNETITLVRLSVVQVAPPSATAVERASVAVSNALEQITYGAKVARAIVQDPVVQEANAVAAPTLLAMTLVNSAGGISVFNLLTYLQFVFTQPILLLGRRKRQKWGVVYNSLTKQPVDLAIVRLMDGATRQVLQTRVTDKLGRYFFFAKKGGYLVEVVKPGYSFPTTFLKDQSEDAEYLDLQHGEVIAVEEDSNIFANIPVDPIEKVEPPKRVLFTVFLQRLRQATAFSAIPMAMVMVWITPGVPTASLLLAQVGVYMLFRKIGTPLKAKSWGSVLDVTTRKPVSSVIVRIFDKKFNKLLETQVTDRNGKYGFFVKRNVYYITAEKQGFEKYVSSDINLMSKDSAIIDQDIELKQAK